MKYQSNRRELKAKHSIMGAESIESYSIMANSPQYYKSYEKSLNKIIETTHLKFDNINILSLGSGPAIIEKLIAKRFPNSSVTCLENAIEFLDKLKHEKIPNNLSFLQKDIIKDDFSEYNEKFDLIISTNLIHHTIDVKKHLNNAYSMLKTNGTLYLEDLKFDASFEAVKNYCGLICEIKEFSDKHWLFYIKLIGLIESYAVSFTVDELLDLLKAMGLQASYEVDESKYYVQVIKK